MTAPLARAHKPFVEHISIYDLVLPVTNWQNILESGLKVVAPTIALNIVIFVRTVASGTLIQEVRASVRVAFELLEPADLGHQIDKQAVEGLCPSKIP